MSLSPSYFILPAIRVQKYTFTCLLYRILRSYRFNYNTHTGQPVLKDWKKENYKWGQMSCALCNDKTGALKDKQCSEAKI